MATAREENPYESGGGFGKFRKRPLRRNQGTPYDRPATALRNPSRNNNGWLSKLVDPAQRLITYSAHRLFSSVFRNRLTAPPSETVPEVRDNHQESAIAVANESNGKHKGVVGESSVQNNCSDGGGLTELEKLLKQKTFSRSEIDHLTELLRSRTVDSPVGKGKMTEVVPSDSMLGSERKEEYPQTPVLENGIGSDLVSTPYVTPSVSLEDVASPAELAKAYMGSRPSKVSPSLLGLRNSPKEDPNLLQSQHFSHKSPIMSIVPRATTTLARVHENGFVTPRSRGRSAIYSMARTPYSRVYPASKPKGVGIEGDPSSSSQYALDHDVLSGSKQGALKRRSSVLDNDIGSFGPVRRTRHKSSLLSSKGLALPHSGSHLSLTRSGVGVDAAWQHSSSIQKPTLLGGVKHSHMKLSAENIDVTMPSTSFPPSSKSSATASKILEQLDRIVSPNEKSSEMRLQSMNDKSPTKLSPSMLRGRALRSMETVDSSKLLDNIRDNELDGSHSNLSASAQKLSKIDKVESGPSKVVSPDHGLVPFVTNADATVTRSQVTSTVKFGDSSVTKSVSYPPQKKRAFHMSAHEDYLDLDDDAYPNGAASPFSTSGKETGSTTVSEKTNSFAETAAQEMPPRSSVVMLSKSSKVGTADRSIDDGKVNALTTLTSSIADTKPTTDAVKAATHTIFGSDKSTSPNGSVGNPSLFTFGNKVVTPTELTGADAPSKESNKSGPVLEKATLSKEQGSDAPFVSFGINKNVDNVPQVPFTFSSSVGGESGGSKFAASSDSKLSGSTSPTPVAGAADSMPKVNEPDNADDKATVIAGSSAWSSEPALTPAASASLLTSPTSNFTFGNISNKVNGSAVSSPTFSSPFPSAVTNNSTSQNIFSSSFPAASISATATSTSTSMTSSTPAIFASSNSNSSTQMMASSSPTTSFFKFGSTPSPSAGLPISSSDSEPVETKSRQDAGIGNLGGTSFGSSSAFGSTGSGTFGFSSPAMTTVNSKSPGSVLGTTTEPVLGTLAPSATSGFATSTQTQSVAFGSSAPSSLFGLTGNTAVSSGSSLFPSASPSSNIFTSGTTSGQSAPASSLGANPVSSNNGTSSTLFGLSSWQPGKSSPFGTSFSSSASSTPAFPFGTTTPSVASSSSPMMFGSSTSASGPQFSFTSAVATTNTLPTFGSPSPAYAFGATSGNNDQMSMEDSMAEDSVQATPPVSTVFGQQTAPVQSNFVFGGSTPTGANPFQFGGQQNIAPPNPSPFQASGSLDFNSGGSFSLGTGGGDKSGRKFVKVKHRQRKK